MPSNYTYPGVYVEEIPSGVRTITGVSTSDTAFIDFFAKGPVDDPVMITSFGDFDRYFGGLDKRSEASYAIQQYYLNGGSIAWVVRVMATNALPAKRTLTTKIAEHNYGYGTDGWKNVLEVEAFSPGTWGNNIQIAVDHKTRDPNKEFNLVVREVQVNGKLQIIRSETFRNLNMDIKDVRFAPYVVNDKSSLVKLKQETLGELPGETGEDVIGKPDEAEFLILGADGYYLEGKKEKAKDEWIGKVKYQAGADGHYPGIHNNQWKNSEGAIALLGSKKDQTGIYALEKIAPYIFNILCIPAAAKLTDKGMKAVYTDAETFCEGKRAFLIVDIPEDKNTQEDISDWSIINDLRHNNAAVYFPLLEIPDRLNEFRPRKVGASGTLAGIYARTDATRGVWKAPAGTEAKLRGTTVTSKLTDLQNGALNPLGINVLRTFPIYGNISWGARTLNGADQQASEWKYIPIRRTALYIEESLYQGLKWVVFEPNDEPLWAQIRLNVGAFMHNLFRQSAFQGKTPREAYLVKCDSETTIQNDIDRGIVNIVVGFAPLKPAEFVIIKIQQLTRQIET